MEKIVAVPTELVQLADSDATLRDDACLEDADN